MTLCKVLFNHGGQFRLEPNTLETAEGHCYCCYYQGKAHPLLSLLSEDVYRLSMYQ